MAEARIVHLLLARVQRELRECIEFSVRLSSMNDVLQQRLDAAHTAHAATRTALEGRIIQLQAREAELLLMLDRTAEAWRSLSARARRETSIELATVLQAISDWLEDAGTA